MFALPPLRRTLAAALRDVESKRVDVRRSAVSDLAWHVEAESRADVKLVIERMLLRDPDLTVRAAAALAVADGRFSELVPSLLKALEDPAPRVRQMALLALGELAESSDGVGFEAVAALLTSPLPALRYQALVAWRRLGGRAGAEALLAALSDEDPEIRWVAWSLIDEEFGKLSAHLGSEDVGAFVGMSRDALGAALLVRADEEPVLRIRIVAAAVLVRLGDSTIMSDVLRQVETSRRIGRQDLVDAAFRFGEARFEPARSWLTSHARRGWFEGALGWPALVALAAIGDSSARREILLELDSSSARRRGRAIEVVRRLGLAPA